MATIITKRIINAPASQVWAVIGDFNNVHSFHPYLESVEQLSEAGRGIGATRQCNLYSKSAVVEEVIEWKEGRSFTVQTNDQPVFGTTNGTMRVDALDANSSEVTVVTTYTPKWGFVGTVLDFLLFRRIVKHTVGQVLKSLQHHLITGEIIGKGGKPLSPNSQSLAPS